MLFSQTVDDKALVWTGSYNFTQRASEKNEENVLIIENQALFEAYSKSFQRLKKKSLQISGNCLSEKYSRTK
jgi:phosphatidylserine/phosphatidylglycerophosphate/cardiolipin synthase-like enzyme